MGKIAEENEDEYEDEYDSILAQIRPRIDKGKGKEVALLTPPHPGQIPPSPPGMSPFEASPGGSTIQSITPVEVVASSTPRSSSSSVYSTATASDPGSPSPQPSSSSITSSAAGSSRHHQRVPVPTNTRRLKTFEQPMRGPTPWLTAPEVDAGEEGERLRQKTLRARMEAEKRERVRKEKKTAEKERKAAEKAAEKEKKLEKKASKGSGSMWGLRKE